MLGAIVGAAAQYFLDPLGGSRRRSVATDKAGKYARQAGSEAASKAEYAAGVAKGAAVEAAKAASPGGTGSDELNDPALARKVESEIFRAADAPKGEVDVNVENHVVYLRGQVDAETADRLVSEAEKVEGVERVESLLETAGRK
jgi:osmotically-inducible protein OsmY